MSSPLQPQTVKLRMKEPNPYQLARRMKQDGRFYNLKLHPALLLLAKYAPCGLIGVRGRRTFLEINHHFHL